MAVLFLCTEQGDFKRLHELLNNGENPNVPNEDGNTPLHLAAFKEPESPHAFENNKQVARVLIRFGAYVNRKNYHGNTPLHFAAARQNYDMIEILLQCGAEIDFMDEDGNTALHYAIHKCDVLKKVAPEFICYDDHLCTDLRAVCQIVKHSRSFLVINKANNLEETPLMWAIKSGDLRIVEELSQNGANVNQKTSLGNTPLHLAAAVKNYKIIEILMQARAQGDLKDDAGNTALHYAIHNCALWKRLHPQYICPCDHSCTDFRAVKQLVKGISSSIINISNNVEETPLMWAVKVGDLRIVEELSQKEALQNRRDINGNTALHFAVDQPVVNVDIVFQLVRHGSFPFIINTSHKSPINLYLDKLVTAPLTEEKKSLDIMKLFLLKGNFLSGCQIKIKSENLKHNLFICRLEIFRMQDDKITTQLSVYEIVTQVYATNKQFTSELYDQLITKVLTGRYRLYREVIASCFPRAYLSHKFAENCC